MTLSRFLPKHPRRAARAPALSPEAPPLVQRALAGALPGEPAHAATVVRAPPYRGIAPAEESAVGVGEDAAPAVPPAPPDAIARRAVRSEPPGSRTAGLPLAARRALGGLLPVLDDPELRDLLVQVRENRGVLWLDRGGHLQQVPGWDAEPEAVHRLATRLVAAGGRHLDELAPCADVRVGDGIRVHAVLPPVAVAGATVSIRVPRLAAPSFAALVSSGLCEPRTAELLRAAVRCRRNILITGGTGSGKTTLLAALLNLVPPDERIVTIEDLAELRLRHPHVIALEARQASAEGVGAVSLETLLREALRMRPDRIVLGECRGAELATLLAALNTGHDGGAGTLHASGLSEVPARLESLGAVAGMTPQALARQAVSALHVVVHLERDAGRARIASVGRLIANRAGELGVEAWRP